jgi:hypothetical protein
MRQALAPLERVCPRETPLERGACGTRPCSRQHALTLSWHAHRNLHLAVVDLDGGFVGTALLTAARSPDMPLSLTVLDGAALSFADVSAAVDAGCYHAALVALPGASAALAAAARNVSAVAPVSAPLAFVFDEGRGGSAVASLLRSVSAQLTGAASAMTTRALLTSAAADGAAAAALNAGVLASPVHTRVLTLHPVAHAGEHTAAGIAFIDLWIIMLAATSAQLQFYEGTWERAAGIRRDHTVLARMTHEVLVAGALAFWAPVVLRGLGAPLDAPTFFALWAYIWLSLTTFGFIITALMRNLGPARGNLLHTLFLILNLVSSSSVTATELMPPFFRIGLGLPFYNAVAGTRTIMFGSYNHLGRNVGVLFAWIGLVLLTATRAARRHRADLRAAGKL